MEELLKLLLEEVDKRDRELWYTHGYEVQAEALVALEAVLTRALTRIQEGN